MEITCQRCHTEYEFDDALVSDRGTTVKCTNCGEQFKVFRSNAHGGTPGVPERWIVRQNNGNRLEYGTLRELQRAIVGRHVGRNDLLSRGDGPPRPLGAIAELEPFFAARMAAPAQAAQAPAAAPPSLGSTLQSGPASPPVPPAPISPFPPASDLASHGGIPVRTGRTDPPPPPTFDTPAAPAGYAAPPHAAAPAAAGWASSTAASPAASPFAPTPPVAAPPPQGSPAAPMVGNPIVYEGGRPAVSPAIAGPLPPQGGRDFGLGTLASGRPPPHPQPNPYEIAQEPPPTPSVRSYAAQDDEWFDEPRFTDGDPHRSRSLRWLVALFMLGIIGFFGAAIGKRYWPTLKAMSSRLSGGGDTGAAVSNEGRVAELVQQGERALTDGDLDAAKEDFDKASAFAERDPSVLIGLAHLAAVRADTYWLKLRLLSPDQPDIVNATKTQLTDAAARATKAAEQAVEAAPSDPHAARTKIDALRIAGDRGAARLLVGRVSPIASEPDTAYVLAALDLSEDAPSYATVLDRLRAAASAERTPQRASSTLLYALARSGNVAGAREILDRMVAAARPPPLLAELKGFVLRQPGAAAPEVDAGRRGTNADAGIEGRMGTAANAGGGGDQGAARPRASEGVGGGDYHERLRQAEHAASSGQYDRAEQLFRSVLASNPGDTEALSGLGDIAHARGRVDLARSYYEQVLAANPHYLPAMSSLADIRWDMGDKAGAVQLYREILENSSSGSYADRAKRRIAQVEGTGGGSNPEPKATTPSPSPSPRAAPPSDLPPEIDTSDLPGFHK